MKSVLISIQPKWCELIASGKKTVEVRKTRPKLETPFKCYIYRTKGTVKHLCNGKWFNMPVGGKVIGEFVCDEIRDARECFIGPSCLTTEEWLKYTNGYKRQVWCWHISNLEIYNESKPLGAYNYACDKDTLTDCTICAELGILKCKPITRPPQSWRYVEE